MTHLLIKSALLFTLGFMVGQVIFQAHDRAAANQPNPPPAMCQGYPECVGTPASIQPIVEPPTSYVREVSAYTSSVAETDDTPCIAADGSDICARYAAGENICGSNAYPLGTILNVDKLGTCTVADRMSSRFQNRVDWYMGTDRERALQFGVQRLNVNAM